MTVRLVSSPLPIFLGRNSQLLDKGYVFLGQPHRDPREHPIQVYVDERLSRVATQPLRTSAGHVYLDGAPSPIWVAGDYSVLVVDASGRGVCYVASQGAGSTSAPASLPNYSALRSYTGDASTICLGGLGRSESSSATAGQFTRDDHDRVSSDDGGTIIVAANGIRWKRVFSGPADVRWFGALGDGGSDDTSALQRAVDACRHVYLPEGTYLFSSLRLSKRNTRLTGASARTSILKHTGDGAAITCSDQVAMESDSSPAYIESGWWRFEEFTVLVNGSVGFRVGKTRSSHTEWHRVYLRHRQDRGAYRPGTVAIECDNSPWSPTYATYMSRVSHCFVRGFETAVLLAHTVNGWILQHLYTIECLRQVELNGATLVSLAGCYFESQLPAARGLVFGPAGGNSISVVACTFEFPSKAATQYGWDFSAGGEWGAITGVGNKYLIQRDGGALVGKKYTGTPPTTFVELREYVSAVHGRQPAMVAPGALHYQMPATRIGGLGLGNGRLVLGRSDGDAFDHSIEHDGQSSLMFRSAGGFRWANQSGSVSYLAVDVYSHAFAPGMDNAQSNGTARHRWSAVHAANGVISTSDEREKQEIEPLDPALLRAWSKVDFCQYRFRQAVRDKGAAARIHVGVLAQQVKAAFESEGLDAFKYGILCLDRWEEGDVDLADAEVRRRMPSPGATCRERYGIRYEQALALECAYLRSQLGSRCGPPGLDTSAID